MILPVRQLPDPLLKTPSHPVSLEDPALPGFLEDLIATMLHHPRCVGLAAPQVGKNWRIFVADASRVDKPGTRHGRLTFINPTLTLGPEKQTLREGCLSVPDFTGNVRRATSVKIQGWDAQGRWLTLEATGFEAIIFQHEMDHLDGLLFLDRVGSVQTDVFRRKNYG